MKKRRGRLVGSVGSIIILLVLICAACGIIGRFSQNETSEQTNDVVITQSLPTSLPVEPTMTPLPKPIPIESTTINPSGRTLSDCEKAVKAAADVSDMQDNVEDVDSAIQVCKSIDEFKAAVLKFPQALDGVDVEVFLTNRCVYAPSLQDVAICKVINGPVVPTETIDVDATGSPTSNSLSATSQPINEVPIKIIHLTSPIAPNSDAEAIIETEPDTNCSIYVIYKSGASKADGLEDKVSGSDGRCAWQWHVGGRTAPGEWDIEFSVFSNGRNAQLHADFIVTP